MGEKILKTVAICNAVKNTVKNGAKWSALENTLKDTIHNCHPCGQMSLQACLLIRPPGLGVSASFYCGLKCHLFKHPWDFRRTCDQLNKISSFFIHMIQHPPVYMLSSHCSAVFCFRKRSFTGKTSIFLSISQ